MRAAPRARSWLPTLLLLAACSGELPAPATDGVARIDGRTEASFSASVDEVTRGMTPAEREAFTDAALIIDSQTSLRVLRESGGDLAAVQRSMRERLHGKSAAEVLAAAARIGAPK